MESGTERIGSRVDLLSKHVIGDRSTEQRVENLIKINQEIAREKSLYRTEREREQAALMLRPVSSRGSFAIFGGAIGSMPLTAVALNILAGSHVGDADLMWITILFAAAGVTGLVGFLSGRRVASVLRSVERMRFPNRVAMRSLVGFAWGAIAGAAGGLMFFIVGTFLGMIAGGFIGAITVPVFAALHQSIRYGDVVEAKHLVPIALGITLSLCAFILGV